ncbi:MAG: Mur ligase family protein [Patescibacteria group bacterium]
MVKNKIRKITPKFVIKFYHWLWSLLSGVAYGFPSKELTVVGVTGTNGKSTTVKLITEILKEADKKVAVISSINFEVNGERRKNLMKMTMPGRGFIHKFMREAVEKDCDYFVLEVTSEGIEQYRHKFIEFDIAVITNLSPEHIESHGSFKKYRKAKGKFFKATNKTHILNSDDEHMEYFKGFKAQKKYGYGFKEIVDFDKQVQGSNFISKEVGIEFQVAGEKFELSLFGKFNAYNGLAAIAVGQELEIDSKNIKKALRRVTGIPGRMEKVIDQEFTVFVDYAFTPNALEKVYDSIIKKLNPNNLIVVLGSCGGGRDKWKRPVLGEIAAKFADEIIVTNEDPYDEDPKEIINQVAEGTKGKALKIIDRRKAINKALDLANNGDVVVITGKGSESWIQVKNGKKIPWDDREVVKEEYEKISEN